MDLGALLPIGDDTFFLCWQGLGLGTMMYHVDLQVDASQRNVVLQSCPHGTSLSILLGLQFSRGQVGSGGPVLVTHAPRAQHSKL